MSLQEASPTGPFGPNPAQTEPPTAGSPFRQPLDQTVAQQAPLYADDAGAPSDGADLRAQRRRAWLVVGAAIVVPAAIAGVIAWQLFGSSEPAPTITRVATAPVTPITEVAETPAAAPSTVTSTPASTASQTTTSTTTTAASTTVAVETSSTASEAEAETTTATAVDLSQLDPEARLAAWPDVETIQVLEGETLWLIAVNYDTTVSAIATLNGITDVSALSVGQELRVPVGFAEEIETVAAVTTTTETTDAATSTETAAAETAVVEAAAPVATDDLLNWHTIAPVVIEDGDSLAAIADANDTTVEALMALNGIADGNTIYVGDVVLVPVGYSAAADTAALAADSTVAASDDLMEEEPLAASDSEDDMMSD